MAKLLTKRQIQILGFITEYINKNELSPTLEELADHLEITPPAALKHIRALSRKNVISYLPNTARSIKPVNKAAHVIKQFNIPYFEKEPSILDLSESKLESYEAGYRISSIEIEDENYFAIKVTIPTMEDAGIRTGDIAILKKCEDADNNSIVLAIPSEDDYTIQSSLRRYVKLRDKHCILETESVSIGSISTSNYRILGKLMLVKRKYDE